MALPAPPKPPGSNTALRILLVLHAIALVVIGTPLFLLILALTAMVGGDGVTPFVIVALLVGPSIPLNVLAAFHLARRPARARAYLGAAAVPGCLQLLAALWFAVASGGLGIAAVVVPGGLMIAWFVLALRTRALAAPARQTPRPLPDALRDFGIGALSIVLTVALALATFWMLFERPETPTEDFDESVAWQKAEDAIAGAVATFEDFEGFAARSVRANPCLEEFAGGGEYVFYAVSYDFDAAVQASPEKQTEYSEAVFDYLESSGAGADLELRVGHGGGSSNQQADISARTNCIKRVPDPPCIDPQGGVPPANDEVSNIDCP